MPRLATHVSGGCRAGCLEATLVDLNAARTPRRGRGRCLLCTRSLLAARRALTRAQWAPVDLTLTRSTVETSRTAGREEGKGARSSSKHRLQRLGIARSIPWVGPLGRGPAPGGVGAICKLRYTAGHVTRDPGRERVKQPPAYAHRFS